MSPRAIGIEPEVHPITDIEASLLLIAHSKQYQACIDKYYLYVYCPHTGQLMYWLADAAPWQPILK